MLKEKIQSLAEDYHQEAINIRRHLHRHPELSFKETATGQYILQKLKEYGIACQKGWGGGTGIVAMIKGNGPKTIALRADMDALPIVEKNDVPYKSCHEGVMHACGHDVHVASLLGAAKILQNIREELNGNIKLIFQPGEEKLPGGASILIEEGVLKNPTPGAIFGQHVHPPLEVGKAGFRSGTYMGSADELYVTVKGKGGHSALPHDCIDPVLIASQIVIGLQQIVSRSTNPAIPAVLSFGKMNTIGGATNVIPNEVKLEGTFRTMNEEWRTEARFKMKKMAEGIAQSMGGSCDFLIVKGYPCLQNDAALTARARAWAAAYLGKNNVVELPVRLTAEDFAFYSQIVPACFYRLGTANPAKGITSAVHTDTFDVDEDCLKTGMGLMSWLAVNELKRG
ncbi:MAG TPA: amidohydrolase [Bacteroidetes bacterium]|nr:amidohydrolase [Bacteroidota bacterium]